MSEIRIRIAFLSYFHYYDFKYLLPITLSVPVIFYITILWSEINMLKKVVRVIPSDRTYQRMLVSKIKSQFLCKPFNGNYKYSCTMYILQYCTMCMDIFLLNHIKPRYYTKKLKVRLTGLKKIDKRMYNEWSQCHFMIWRKNIVGSNYISVKSL